MVAAHRLPSSLLFFDTETTPTVSADRPGVQEHRLRLGAAVYCRLRRGKVVRRVIHTFQSQDEFHAIIAKYTSDRCPLSVWAHNLPFDLTIVGFWKRLDRGDYQTRVLLPAGHHFNGRTLKRARHWRGRLTLNDPPTNIRVMSQKGVVEFTDTLNYFRVSLRELGESLNVLKQSVSFESAQTNELLRYCIRDAEIVETAVLSLLTRWREGGYGPWRPTAPGLAWGAWEGRFRRHKMYPTKEDEGKTLERACYYGGRTDHWWAGVISPPAGPGEFPMPEEYEGVFPELTGPVFLLDVRGLYPFVMRSRPVPFSLRGVYPGASLARVGRWLRRYEVAALCEIESVDDEYPCRRGGQTRYGVGKFWTALCGDEFRHAYERGHVVRVGACQTYQCTYIFRDYVDHFYGIREKAAAIGDGAGRLFAKLLLNSLYGKFGQLSPRWVTDHTLPGAGEWGPFLYLDLANGQPVACRQLGDGCQRREGFAEPSHSWPVVSAFVTAAGRMRMRELRECAGRQALLLQMTDSLLVTAAGKKRLETKGYLSDAIGGLREIAGPILSGVVHDASWWETPQKVVRFGIKRSAVQLSENEFRQPAFDRLAGVLARGPVDAVCVTDRVVRLAPRAGPDWSGRYGWREPLDLTPRPVADCPAVSDLVGRKLLRRRRPDSPGSPGRPG